MEPIIAAVDPTLIERELTEDLFLRRANNGGTLIFHFQAHEAPHTMRELGRLREEAFRGAGGGTGKSLDVDAFDTAEHPYTQLVVWDPAERMILGGYRYILLPEGAPASRLATSRLFHFSDQFVRNYLPHTIELGRSFVSTAYQATRLRRKGLYALDNLWDGLGGILRLHPGTRYFFGKVTMYTSYNPEARNALMYFLALYFPDREELVRPTEPLPMNINTERMSQLFTGDDYKGDFERLTRELQRLGEHVPPLIKSYINLSPTMRVFGTSVNQEFGQVEETGIMITVDDILPEKRARHVDTFIEGERLDAQNL